ncbi:hypothetical protein [Paenibacillus glufosinatiresistens]|uniref:hypothetical protein n=1 Tax=Paenibacillus glufosinatiresistens TaxID=3070657 RepID=UPI00286DF582|nr:hypothetical protein [Paenibacillus sp. YX.27]
MDDSPAYSAVYNLINQEDERKGRKEETMNFFTKIDSPKINLFQEENNTSEYSVLKRFISEGKSTFITPLVRFIITPLVLKTAKSLYLPCDNQKAYEIIMKELSPHFQTIIEYDSLQTKDILLQTVKENSVQMIIEMKNESSLWSKFITDLYQGETIAGLASEGNREYMYFEINLREVNAIQSPFTEFLWDFWSYTYLVRPGAVYLTPGQWEMDDHFGEHLAVRLLAGFCNQMIVAVHPETTSIHSLILR